MDEEEAVEILKTLPSSLCKDISALTGQAGISPSAGGATRYLQADSGEPGTAARSSNLDKNSQRNKEKAV